MKLPDWLKSGISSAIVVFLVTFLPATLNWISGMLAWASSSGATQMPGVSTLGYAFVSALLAALAGVLMAAFRWAQSKYSFVPGKPPQFQGGK